MFVTPEHGLTSRNILSFVYHVFFVNTPYSTFFKRCPPFLCVFIYWKYFRRVLRLLLLWGSGGWRAQQPSSYHVESDFYNPVYGKLSPRGNLLKQTTPLEEYNTYSSREKVFFLFFYPRNKVGVKSAIRFRT